MTIWIDSSAFITDVFHFQVISLSSFFFTAGISFALKNVYDMFYFKVDLKYHYDIHMEQSRTFDEIRHDIQDEIEDRIRPVLRLTTFSNSGLIFMLFMLVFK